MFTTTEVNHDASSPLQASYADVHINIWKG
nr:MAG TPA: hypothetical protein [Caudoviricetes sp.]